MTTDDRILLPPDQYDRIRARAAAGELSYDVARFDATYRRWDAAEPTLPRILVVGHGGRMVGRAEVDAFLAVASPLLDPIPAPPSGLRGGTPSMLIIDDPVRDPDELALTPPGRLRLLWYRITDAVWNWRHRHQL